MLSFGFDERQGWRRIGKQQRDMSADNVGESRRTAFIRRHFLLGRSTFLAVQQALIESALTECPVCIPLQVSEIGSIPRRLCRPDRPQPRHPRTQQTDHHHAAIASHLISALPPKADITEHDHHVRFVPKADIRASSTEVVKHQLTQMCLLASCVFFEHTPRISAGVYLASGGPLPNRKQRVRYA